MNKKILAAALVAAAALGGAGAADAATGIVDINAVLADYKPFQDAGRRIAAEQQKLQKQYDSESASMSKKDKEALAAELNQKLADKQNKEMKPVQDALRSALEKTAKAKKVDSIVVPGGLVYGTIDVDLTQDVKANMNAAQ